MFPCDCCGWPSYTTAWDRLWGLYLCDYCWEDLEEDYYWRKWGRYAY